MKNIKKHLHKKFFYRIFRLKFICTIFFIAACTNSNKNQNTLTDTIPNIVLKNIDGQTDFNTQKIPSGAPIVFFYFGAFCEPSRKQMKNIIKDIAELKNIRFYLFTGDSIYDARLFSKHFQLYKYSNITVLRDGDGKLAKYFHFDGTPSLAFYNKDKIFNRTIRESIYGRQIKKTIEEE